MNPLVDVHAHFVTPWYAQAAIAAGHERPDGMPGWPQWSADAHLRLMDVHGIDQAVLSVSSPGVHFGDDAAAVALARRVNDFAAQTCAAHPDRFRFFGSLPLPAVDPALAEIDRCLDDLGAAGIVVDTHADGQRLSDPAAGPVLAALDERRAVLFVHPTSPPGSASAALGWPRPMIEFLAETTRTVGDLIMRQLLTAESGLQVIVPHCGAFLPLVADRLQLFAQDLGMSEARVDDVLGTLWYDLAGTPMPTHAPALLSRVGADTFLYGSDHCWTPAPAVAAQIAALDTGWDRHAHGPWRELAADNAARLLQQADRMARTA